MWTYKCHKCLMKPLWFLCRIVNFINVLSWDRAHYRNGSGKDLKTKPINIGTAWSWTKEE